MEKAFEELKEVEHIVRKSPVRKMGEAGTPEYFQTNYVKLKCDHKGVYQYVTKFSNNFNKRLLFFLFCQF